MGDIHREYRGKHVINIGRGRSKLLNLCPIPIALCCNKNMFKSNQKS